jgi:hypothetical protein
MLVITKKMSNHYILDKNILSVKIKSKYLMKEPTLVKIWIINM